jgi:glutamine synthetase
MSASVFLNPEVFNNYMSLPITNGKVQAEYIWIGGSGQDLRGKTKTLDKKPTSVSELPIWNYDGSSTGQAPGKDSEVYLKPVAMYPDPFRRGDNVLVLCEACLPDGNLTPIPTNTRNAAAKIMEAAKEHKPWFGIEQEYTLYNKNGKTPLGFPEDGFPRPQGPYYCSVGLENAYGRRVVEAHYRCCLYAGLNISGVNAEVMPGQWEYQIGPCEGISSGDQMWISRYLMQRVCEDFGVRVSFDPKPVTGDWNGAGCHTNYSTQRMREDGGFEAIIVAVEKLGKKHAEHIAVYGEGNARRLTGAHETAPIDQFSYGVANRGSSIRIPRQAKLENKGYFEDRRPASNMDPYVVTSKIVSTTIIE